MRSISDQVPIILPVVPDSASSRGPVSPPISGSEWPREEAVCLATVEPA